PLVAQLSEESGILRCSAIREMANVEELRVRAKTLSVFHAIAATSRWCNLIDLQRDRLVHAMIAFIIDFCHPVMAKVLLHSELPLLQIRQHWGQLQLINIRRRLGETCRNERLAVRIDVRRIVWNSLIEFISWSHAI